MTTRTNKLRAAMLVRPELFDGIRLTPQQREVVLAAKDNADPLISHGVSALLAISLQQACVVLKACYDKGYLKRRNIGDKTGGTQWAYVYALGGDT